MSDASVKMGEDTSLATKCLDFCRHLASKGKDFTFSLSMGSNFSFSLDTRENTTLSRAGKKKTPSPSTLARNAKRRDQFLKKKFEPAAQAKDEDSVEFKCDQCNYVSTTDKGLQIHIGKKHKISQIDGVVDVLEEHKQTQTDVFSDDEEIPFKIDHEADDAARVIEAKLKPPKYVEDSKYGLGILSSFDDGVICYKFKCQNAQNKEDYFENEVLTYKITLPNI